MAKTDHPLENLPDPGADRFFVGVHNPSNAKYPMMLELRQSTISGREHKVNFSRLIAKQPVIADPKAIVEAAEEILVRAGRVDEFVGILGAK